MGLMYESGFGVKLSHMKALKWYKLLASQGDPKGIKKFAENFRLFHSEHSLDTQELLNLLTKFAEQGNSHAQNKLGELFFKGSGYTQNYLKAHKR